MTGQVNRIEYEYQGSLASFGLPYSQELMPAKADALAPAAAGPTDDSLFVAWQPWCTGLLLEIL